MSRVLRLLQVQRVQSCLQQAFFNWAKKEIRVLRPKSISTFLKAHAKFIIKSSTFSPVLLKFKEPAALLVFSAASVGAAAMADAELSSQADQLYEQMEYAKIVEMLEPKKECDDVELLWRLARAMYEQHKRLGSDAEKLSYLQQGKVTVERAMQLNDKHPNCHKWMAIYLNAITKLQGSRAQIEQGQVIKGHMLKACEYGPSDPTNWHLIGMWAFTVADISWTMRKLAQVIFGEPPKATFQEALEYFLKAEEAQPGSYSMNLLMIAKSYQKLKDNDNAIVYLKKTRDYPVKTMDDQQAHKEAVDLLKYLGVKD
ncbi:Regulator of microtubule dynamics protein 1 [Amphibalanus amphitrite]|uniref:Regulator of microtubule dynamics protein 1 n=1 Tax=Amphibalanus amphitrite TaxID=1232801 RepID=A0A6A4WP83_AMPAM|nr:Regulator of microtubule dynamics protein 1 [Amphibalanus amphitrite]